MAKTIRPKRQGKVLPTEPLNLIVLRDGVEEEHEFTVSPRVHFGDILGLINASARRNATQEQQLEAIPYMIRLLRRAMVNTDGTPEKWTPKVVKGDDDGDYFTAPDGRYLPAAQVPFFTAFDVGSSRRRWVGLLLDDDDVEIEEEQIIEAMHWIVSLAGSATGGEEQDPPSSRSSSS